MDGESVMRNASGKGERVARSPVRPIVWFFVALALIAGTSEAILRFGFGLGNPVLITRDPACGYILKPDQDVVRFFVRTRINHDGMRSDEVPSVHARGQLRLLFVGDSITYGTTRVDQKEIFTEVLHSELPAIVHHPVEVLNASAGAWAPDNELAFIRSRGIFDSDIVLVVLNDGDLTQPRATIDEVGEDLPQKRPVTAVGELYSRYLRPRLHHLIRGDAGDSIVANQDEAMRHNLADLDQIDTLVKSQHARLILVYIPFRKDVPQVSGSAAVILQTWSGAHHVAMCDVTLAESAMPSKEITLDHGIHFNAKGHLLIAREIERQWPALAGK